MKGSEKSRQSLLDRPLINSNIENRRLYGVSRAGILPNTAREENITKAAEFLHITYPALSRQLIVLEEEVGITLFKRENTGIIWLRMGN